ncbi:hypothetical protein [Neomoorella glycerini]|nr:hypothetical protein [Moorella glycerini]
MPPDRIRHIAKHSVTPEEVEQVAYEDRHHIVQRLKPSTSYPSENVYRLLGRTEARRYLKEELEAINDFKGEPHSC